MTYLDAKELVRFLNKESSFPIVAHNVKYDRDEVLKPVFKRLGLPKILPHNGRWVCTIELAKQRTDLVHKDVSKNLDSLLKHFKLEPRDPEKAHDAYIDCKKASQIYMKLTEGMDDRA